jgi:hypothetical protein
MGKVKPVSFQRGMASLGRVLNKVYRARSKGYSVATIAERSGFSESEIDRLLNRMN